MNRIKDIQNKPEWVNTRQGIWHRKIKDRARPQIYYERKCPVCKEQFAASTIHVKYCSNSCHSSIFQLGEKSHRWRGGICKGTHGYVLELHRDHPNAIKPNFYIPQHRIVMEKILDRYL